jgi:hypothetical protein
MPNSGTKPRQFGHLQQFGIQLEEIVIKGFGDLPKLIGVDVSLVENLADGARVARQLLRQPYIAAPLPLQLGPYPFSDMWKFVHSVALLQSFALKKQPQKKAWKLFALPSAVDLLDYQDREASTKSPRHTA